MAGGGGGPEAELMSQNLCLQQERWFSVGKNFLISVFKLARKEILHCRGRMGVWQGKELLPLLFLKSIFIGICWFTMSC